MKPWKYLVAQNKLKDKTKNGENLQSLEVVEVVLVQCNLVNNQCQQNSVVLNTFMPINLMLICWM